jgi:hypothetical protein
MHRRFGALSMSGKVVQPIFEGREAPLRSGMDGSAAKCRSA